jgi:fluoride exporter
VTLLAIAVGGAAGALARHGVAVAVGAPSMRGFPWATFTVNVSGSVVAGFVFALLAHRWPQAEWLRSGGLVGFLGAYTTFSAFALQTQQLFERDAASIALVNVLASVVACVAAASLGVWAGRALS